MKNRIEQLIRILEQMHAEAIVENLSIVGSLEEILDNFYWLYKEVSEYSEE